MGAGYEVTTASSGEAAIKFINERKFDLVLTDLKMTGMSGIELLQHVIALRPVYHRGPDNRPRNNRIR